MNLKALRNEFSSSNTDKRELDIAFGAIFNRISGKDYMTSAIIGYELQPSEEHSIRTMMRRVQNGEPLQYVIGKWEFMGRTFIVTPDVLIPRPDTEILCECAANYIKGRSGNVAVLDLCTGSGCIGISIACEAKNSTVSCEDISKAALKIAEENARLNGAKINFILSDMFENCGTYDVIVSNPPYIPTKTIDELASTVKNFEPHIALDGGEDGLDFYRIIAKNAKKHMTCGGKLFLEIGCDQRESVSRIFADNGYCDTQVVRDYGSNDRVIICGYGE